MDAPITAWRISRKPHADLSGEGAMQQGGRWNSPGLPMVYMSLDAALPVLEIMVHLDLPPELIPLDYVLMKVDLTCFAKTPTADWLEEWSKQTPPSENQSHAFGNNWLQEQRSVCLKTPSAIIPESYNLLLNPSHPLLKKHKIKITQRPFSFDARLFSINQR